MRAFLTASALAIAVAAPSVAAAQDLTVDAGFTLTSRYVSSGIAYSKGAAVQPYVELGVAGFYAGVWASNVSGPNSAPATREIDLYFGYRNEVGILSYDVGYARYTYNKGVGNAGEFLLSMEVAPTDMFTLGAALAYDNKAKVTNSSVSVGFAVNDKIGLHAGVGRVNKGGQRYWNVGGSYAFTDQLSADLTYHNTNQSKGLAVLSLSYNFSLR